jgi:hypothetical protein
MAGISIVPDVIRGAIAMRAIRTAWRGRDPYAGARPVSGILVCMIAKVSLIADDPAARQCPPYQAITSL